ncbi:MAG: tetratricopeptide repeat protein [Terriglobia bacterium]|jgi:Flp pilus assembly protein TadD
MRARIWLAQRENAKAVLELQTAAKLRPDYEQAWSDLGGILRLQGDTKGAQQALEKAVALDPNDATAHYRLRVQYLENGEPHRAVPCFEKALHDDSEDRAILYNLALALLSE